MYYRNQTPSRNDRTLVLSDCVVYGRAIPLESRVWKALRVLSGRYNGGFRAVSLDGLVGVKNADGRLLPMGFKLYIVGVPVTF